MRIIVFVTKVDTVSMVVQRVTGLVLTLNRETKTVSVLARGPEYQKLSENMTWSDQNCQTKGVY